MGDRPLDVVTFSGLQATLGYNIMSATRDPARGFECKCMYMYINAESGSGSVLYCPENHAQKMSQHFKALDSGRMFTFGVCLS